ncbi:MAG: helix-hairpin-helix domain-containing protein [Candidatus Bipolaricaulia bacterium]
MVRNRTNHEVARIFYRLALLLEYQEVPFKPRAYRRAAAEIEAFSEVIERVWREGQLEKLPGVGVNIANKIDEYFRTGKVATLERLKREVPVDVRVLEIDGIGPKTARRLHEALGVRDLDDLRQVVEAGRLRELKGLGKKFEGQIRKSLTSVKDSKADDH